MNEPFAGIDRLDVREGPDASAQHQPEQHQVAERWHRLDAFLYLLLRRYSPDTIEVLRGEAERMTIRGPAPFANGWLAGYAREVADSLAPAPKTERESCVCCGDVLTPAEPEEPLCEKCFPSFERYADGAAFCDHHPPANPPEP